MVKVAELAAEVKLKGASEANKQVKELTNSFGFLGSAASGVLTALEVGFKILDAGAKQGIQVAREIDRVTFKTGIGAQSFQRLDRAFKQHGGNVNSLVDSYRHLQQRMAEWKTRGTISENENYALGFLGVDPSQYGNTKDLLEAITKSLLRVKDIGQRNMLAGILGIDLDFLRVAEKGKYYVNDLLKLSQDEQKTLNDWEQNINNLSNDFEDMFTKLGTMVLAGAGKDFTQWLIGVDQYLSNAVGNAKNLSDVIDNLGGTSENRNWFGKISDALETLSIWSEGRKNGEDTEMTTIRILTSAMLKKIKRDGRMQNVAGVDNSLWTDKNDITPKETRKNGLYIMQQLMAAGYSKEVAAAFVGGFVSESKLNPRIVGDNGTSFGIAQWHNDRASGLAPNLSAQGAHLIKELSQMGMTPERANKMSFQQAGDWALRVFENPWISDAQKGSAAYNAAYRRKLNERLKYGLPFLEANILDPQSGKFAGVAQNQMLSSDNRNITNNIYLENKIATNNLDAKGILSITGDSYKQSIDETGMAIT